MERNEYIIVTDSTTDMGADYYKENDVALIGMQYIIDDKEYVQYTENALTTKEFYDMVRKGSMPKTSQASYERLFKTFEEIAKEGKDIFYLCFSSALSGTYQTGTLVARDIEENYRGIKVKVVDSISACGGEGHLLNNCVKKRNEGLSIDELVEYANEIKSRTVHLFTVDDLNHLHRGGRLSKMSAILGGMLGIKPILFFNELGQLLPYSKVRGRKNALEAMVKQMEKTFIPEENEEIFINDADSRADAEYLGELIKKKMPSVKKIRYGDIGAVIGAHAGPGTVALFYLAKDRTIVEV